MIFVGVDWAEAHHDVWVQDDDGSRLGGGRLPEGMEGVARFHDLVGRFAETPDEVVIGIETDRGLCVGRGRLPGVRGEPAVDLPLPGPSFGVGGQVRPR